MKIYMLLASVPLLFACNADTELANQSQEDQIPVVLYSATPSINRNGRVKFDVKLTNQSENSICIGPENHNNAGLDIREAKSRKLVVPEDGGIKDPQYETLDEISNRHHYGKPFEIKPEEEYLFSIVLGPYINPTLLSEKNTYVKRLQKNAKLVGQVHVIIFDCELQNLNSSLISGEYSVVRSNEVTIHYQDSEFIKFTY